MPRTYRQLAVILAIVAFLPPVARAQSVDLNLPYVEGGGPEQRLDLYTPGVAAFPTLLFVHEGGLTSGSRKDPPYAQMCETLQAMGIGCALADYRLAPQHQWPAQPKDVVSAFGWLKGNLAARGGDPARVFLFGHSSGCLVVASVGADSAYLVGGGWNQSDVAGVIAMGCRLNDDVKVSDKLPDEYEASWVPPGRIADFLRQEPAFASIDARNDAVPARHVTGDLPPTLVLVAEGERFFPRFCATEPSLSDGPNLWDRKQN